MTAILALRRGGDGISLLQKSGPEQEYLKGRADGILETRNMTFSQFSQDLAAKAEGLPSCLTQWMTNDFAIRPFDIMISGILRVAKARCCSRGRVIQKLPLMF